MIEFHIKRKNTVLVTRRNNILELHESQVYNLPIFPLVSQLKDLITRPGWILPLFNFGSWKQLKNQLFNVEQWKWTRIKLNIRIFMYLAKSF